MSGFGSASLLLALAGGLFWIGLLGLLWRRSLVGMLTGVAFAWLAVAVSVIGFSLDRVDAEGARLGASLAVTAAVLAGLQIAMGLALVIARIKRRGSLDADDAGLLEG